MDLSTYCPLPFMHSHNSLNGNFKPCCNASHADFEHNARMDLTTGKPWTLETWFNSDYMQQLRHDSLNGIQNPMCGACWRKESVSGTSIRNRMIERYGPLTDISNPRVQYLDLKLSNECNLQCIMCDGINSHQIAQVKDKMLELGYTVPTNWEEKAAVWTDPEKRLLKVNQESMDIIFKYMPDLHTLKITGGEPSIQKEVLDILDYAIDNNYAKNLELNLTSNGTKLNKHLLERLRTFKHVKFNISIDGMGSTYEYIRYPFKFKKIEERLQEIKFFKYSMGLTIVPQLLNLENLVDFREWAIKNKYSVYYDNIIHPPGGWNSLENAPYEIIKHVLKYFPADESSTVLIRSLEKLANLQNKPTHANKIKLAATIKSLDQYRNQDYREMLQPLTKKYIEECLTL